MVLKSLLTFWVGSVLLDVLHFFATYLDNRTEIKGVSMSSCDKIKVSYWNSCLSNTCQPSLFFGQDTPTPLSAYPFKHIFKIRIIPNRPIRFLHNRKCLTHNRQIFSFRFVRGHSLWWPIKKDGDPRTGTQNQAKGKTKCKPGSPARTGRHPCVDQGGSHAKLNGLLTVSVRQQP